MTPYQLADAECANFTNGRCATLGRKCKLAVGAERCKYFEECIVPLKTHTKHPDHARYVIAIDNYINSRNIPGRVATVRKCVCGNPLAPRQHRCSDCGKVIAKIQARERKQKQRESKNSRHVTL